MTGWLIFALLAAVVLAAVALIGRADRGTVMLVASALFVAAAGYAWQGSPGQAGAPRDPTTHGLGADTLFVAEHQRLLERFGETAQWLSFADSLNRMGEDRAAATALHGAIAKHPSDLSLRIGYAHALLVLADYRVTPAVALAFRDAEAIAPDDPAPLYFEGLASFEGGDPAGAERQWRSLLTELPTGSSWRGVVSEKLRLFDMMRAQSR